MPPQENSFEFSHKKLDDFIKSLKNVPVARVGILGDKNSRRDDNSNASIGIKHEFGQDGMPIRSFLRIPLIDNMQKYLEGTKAFEKSTLNEVLASKTLLPWVKKLGILAEAIIADAFATGGFGKWKPSNMRFKKNHQTLVETQQLRNSITSEVKE